MVALEVLVGSVGAPLTLSVFPHQDSRVIPASQRLYGAVVHNTLVLLDLPEPGQLAAGAIAKHSRRGWRIDRPNPRVEIDAITALMRARPAATRTSP